MIFSASTDNWSADRRGDRDGSAPPARTFLAVSRLIAMTLIVIPSATEARAWGSDGHRIIAEIAEQYFEPATARQVRDILAIENETTLAAVSTWADQVRGQRRNTAPWHYVNIPISAAGYNAARDCQRGACVVAKIDQFAAALRARNVSPRQRLEALKFLVHFVGDVHQPLHASNNNDRGGNDIDVEFNGRSTNLHAVWDTDLLAPVVQGDERSYALKLARSITPAHIKAWRSGTPVGWANESHAIAVQVIYGTLPHSPGVLPEDYEAKAMPLIDQQLARAGVRLAMVLNAVMK